MGSIYEHLCLLFVFIKFSQKRQIWALRPLSESTGMTSFAGFGFVAIQAKLLPLHGSRGPPSLSFLCFCVWPRAQKKGRKKETQLAERVLHCCRTTWTHSVQNAASVPPLLLIQIYIYVYTKQLWRPCLWGNNNKKLHSWYISHINKATFPKKPVFSFVVFKRRGKN